MIDADTFLIISSTCGGFILGYIMRHKYSYSRLWGAALTVVGGIGIGCLITGTLWE